MSYAVYRHTSPSGKVYIGITSQKPENRWGRGGAGYKNNAPFWEDIQKYGWDNFSHVIIRTDLTQKEAEIAEASLISAHDSANPLKGYNLGLGGNTGAKHSPETRKKIGEANKRRVWTTEMRANVGAASRDRRPSLEARRRMSEAHRGERNHNYGKKFSEETRQKLSDARRGERAPNWGKHLSEETRRKVGQAKQKPVLCVNTGVIYSSIKDAAVATGTHPSDIGAVCHGRREHTKGLGFTFAEREVIQ